MLLLKYEKMNYSTPYAMMTNKRDARNYTKIENRKDFIKLLNHTTGMIIFHAKWPTNASPCDPKLLHHILCCFLSTIADK
jgi:hypothetical protein